eukprot:g610.t1
MQADDGGSIVRPSKIKSPLKKRQSRAESAEKNAARAPGGVAGRKADQIVSPTLGNAMARSDPADQVQDQLALATPTSYSMNAAETRAVNGVVIVERDALGNLRIPEEGRAGARAPAGGPLLPGASAVVGVPLHTRNAHPEGELTEKPVAGEVVPPLGGVQGGNTIGGSTDRYAAIPQAVQTNGANAQSPTSPAADSSVSKKQWGALVKYLSIFGLVCATALGASFAYDAVWASDDATAAGGGRTCEGGYGVNPATGLCEPLLSDGSGFASYDSLTGGGAAGGSNGDAVETVDVELVAQRVAVPVGLQFEGTPQEAAASVMSDPLLQEGFLQGFCASLGDAFAGDNCNEWVSIVAVQPSQRRSLLSDASRRLLSSSPGVQEVQLDIEYDVTVADNTTAEVFVDVITTMDVDLMKENMEKEVKKRTEGKAQYANLKVRDIKQVKANKKDRRKKKKKVPKSYVVMEDEDETAGDKKKPKFRSNVPSMEFGIRTSMEAAGCDGDKTTKPDAPETAVEADASKRPAPGTWNGAMAMDNWSSILAAFEEVFGNRNELRRMKIHVKPNRKKCLDNDVVDMISEFERDDFERKEEQRKLDDEEKRLKERIAEKEKEKAKLRKAKAEVEGKKTEEDRVKAKREKEKAAERQKNARNEEERKKAEEEKIKFEREEKDAERKKKQQEAKKRQEEQASLEQEKKKEEREQQKALEKAKREEEAAKRRKEMMEREKARFSAEEKKKLEEDVKAAEDKRKKAQLEAEKRKLEREKIALEKQKEAARIAELEEERKAEEAKRAKEKARKEFEEAKKRAEAAANDSAKKAQAEKEQKELAEKLAEEEEKERIAKAKQEMLKKRQEEMAARKAEREAARKAKEEELKAERAKQEQEMKKKKEDEARALKTKEEAKQKQAAKEAADVEERMKTEADAAKKEQMRKQREAKQKEAAEAKAAAKAAAIDEMKQRQAKEAASKEKEAAEAERKKKMQERQQLMQKAKEKSQATEKADKKQRQTVREVDDRKKARAKQRGKKLRRRALRGRGSELQASSGLRKLLVASSRPVGKILHEQLHEANFPSTSTSEDHEVESRALTAADSGGDSVAASWEEEQVDFSTYEKAAFENKGKEREKSKQFVAHRNRKDYRRPITVPATVQYGANTWHRVGLTLLPDDRANNKFSPKALKKRSMHLNFGKFRRGQRFFGFKKLKLYTSNGDKSRMREKLMSDLYALSGLAVAHSQFYAVYLDSANAVPTKMEETDGASTDGFRFLGIYLAVEDETDTVRQTQFFRETAKGIGSEDASTKWEFMAADVRQQWAATYGGGRRALQEADADVETEPVAKNPFYANGGHMYRPTATSARMSDYAEVLRGEQEEGGGQGGGTNRPFHITPDMDSGDVQLRLAAENLKKKKKDSMQGKKKEKEDNDNSSTRPSASPKNEKKKEKLGEKHFFPKLVVNGTDPLPEFRDYRSLLHALHRVPRKSWLKREPIIDATLTASATGSEQTAQQANSLLRQLLEQDVSPSPAPSVLRQLAGATAETQQPKKRKKWRMQLRFDSHRDPQAVQWRSLLAAAFDTHAFLSYLALTNAFGNAEHNYGSKAGGYLLYNAAAGQSRFEHAGTICMLPEGCAPAPVPTGQTYVQPRPYPQMENVKGQRLTWLPTELSKAFSGKGVWQKRSSLDHSKLQPGWPLIQFLYEDSVTRSYYLYNLEKLVGEKPCKFTWLADTSRFAERCDLTQNGQVDFHEGHAQFALAKLAAVGRGSLHWEEVLSNLVSKNHVPAGLLRKDVLMKQVDFYVNFLKPYIGGESRDMEKELEEETEELEKAAEEEEQEEAKIVSGLFSDVVAEVTGKDSGVVAVATSTAGGGATQAAATEEETQSAENANAIKVVFADEEVDGSDGDKESDSTQTAGTPATATEEGTVAEFLSFEAAATVTDENGTATEESLTEKDEKEKEKAAKTPADFFKLGVKALRRQLLYRVKVVTDGVKVLIKKEQKKRN